MSDPTERLLIGTRAAAEILGVHENTVRNFVKRGWLSPAWVMPSGYKRFDPSEVMALAEAEAAWRKHTTAKTNIEILTEVRE